LSPLGSYDGVRCENDEMGKPEFSRRPILRKGMKFWSAPPERSGGALALGLDTKLCGGRKQKRRRCRRSPKNFVTSRHSSTDRSGRLHGLRTRQPHLSLARRANFISKVSNSERSELLARCSASAKSNPCSCHSSTWASFPPSCT
jgi:hypothetical protein